MTTQIVDRTNARHARHGHIEATRQLEEVYGLGGGLLEAEVDRRLTQVISGPAPQAFKDAFEATFLSGVTAATSGAFA